MPQKKPLTIVSKTAARIAAVQIFYNTIISKRNISDVFQDYIISFKGDLEHEFEIKTLNEEYLNSLVLGFNIDLNKEIETYEEKNKISQRNLVTHSLKYDLEIPEILERRINPRSEIERSELVSEIKSLLFSRSSSR